MARRRARGGWATALWRICAWSARSALRTRMPATIRPPTASGKKAGGRSDPAHRSAVAAAVVQVVAEQ